VLVAVALKLGADDSDTLAYVVECAEALGASEYVEKVTASALPPPSTSSKAAGARSAAREWWRSRAQESAICDGCERPLSRGEGYMLSDRSARVQLDDGSYTDWPMGDKLLCRSCLEA
jgi:hypothetical protein